MSFLDVFVSPFSPGTSAAVVFGIGLIFVFLICTATAALLILHFRKEQRREEKRREKGKMENKVED